MTLVDRLPPFCEGILNFGDGWRHEQDWASSPVLDSDTPAVTDLKNPRTVFQALLLADALRYLVLQMCATKESGHIGGFFSAAEAYAALYLLGQKNILCDVGHHVPGLYAALFLDRSLEVVGIGNVGHLCSAFRKQSGLPGHPSVGVPGILAPAGPLGQAQHFAMAAALRYPRVVFPLIIGDGGLDEPYILTSLHQYSIAFPSVTNVLPVVVWNGFSQEHHSTLSTLSDDDVRSLLTSHGFAKVEIVNAAGAEPSIERSDALADSTVLPLGKRLDFQQRVLEAIARGVSGCGGGSRWAVVIKQRKGAGSHESGARSHCLAAGDSLDNPCIRKCLEKLALSVRAWLIVRQNLVYSGGGPAAKQIVSCCTEPVPTVEYGGEDDVGSIVSSAGAFAEMVVSDALGDQDYLVTNADGHVAMAMGILNEYLGIRHPTSDSTYNQHVDGRVFSPVNEDAGAGLAGAVALLGGRSVWTSYQSFAVNGLGVLQTAAQAMAEAERPRHSILVLLTATPLEQYRNGWTHQRPEIEAYLGAMVRGGNVYVVYPPDANTARETYRWATTTRNKCIVVICSRTPLPNVLAPVDAAKALRQGAVTVANPSASDVLLVAVGDMSLQIARESQSRLGAEGIGVRLVSVICPRRLYREGDIEWRTRVHADNTFISDSLFDQLFACRALVGVCVGSSASLEPVLLRSRASRREVVCWKRGYTASSIAELSGQAGCGVQEVVQRVRALA